MVPGELHGIAEAKAAGVALYRLDSLPSAEIAYCQGVHSSFPQQTGERAVKGVWPAFQANLSLKPFQHLGYTPVVQARDVPIGLVLGKPFTQIGLRKAAKRGESLLPPPAEGLGQSWPASRCLTP